MEELEYWRIKSKIAELEIEKLQVQQLLVNIQARKADFIKQIGLNPSKNYRFVDETFTIEEIKNGE